MRVLQLITRFDFGGAENHVRELCNELANQGVEVFLATECGRQKDLLDPRVKFIRTAKWIRLLLLPQAIFIAYTVFKHRINIIHAHQRLPIISACLAGVLTGAPVVATVHGRVRHDLRSWLARRLSSKIIFVSERVLTVSKHYKRLTDKSVIIPNGIPIPEHNPKITPFALSYISRFDARHTAVIESLARAIEQLHRDFPAITLSVYGDGQALDKITRGLAEINNRIGTETIYIKGYTNLIEEETMPELIAGTGRIAIEALVRGISVLSVNYKRMGDIVTLSNYSTYAINNFVDVNGTPPTSETIHNTIKFYLENRERLRSEAAELQKRAAHDFGIAKITQRISHIYQSLLEGR